MECTVHCFQMLGDELMKLWATIEYRLISIPVNFQYYILSGTRVISFQNLKGAIFMKPGKYLFTATSHEGSRWCQWHVLTLASQQLGFSFGLDYFSW